MFDTFLEGALRLSRWHPAYVTTPRRGSWRKFLFMGVVKSCDMPFRLVGSGCSYFPHHNSIWHATCVYISDVKWVAFLSLFSWLNQFEEASLCVLVARSNMVWRSVPILNIKYQGRNAFCWKRLTGESWHVGTTGSSMGPSRYSVIASCWALRRTTILRNRLPSVQETNSKSHPINVQLEASFQGKHIQAKSFANNFTSPKLDSFRLTRIGVDLTLQYESHLVCLKPTSFLFLSLLTIPSNANCRSESNILASSFFQRQISLTPSRRLRMGVQIQEIQTENRKKLCYWKPANLYSHYGLK